MTLEPARSRAEVSALRGPRAGRLQQDRLHFAIWHMCRRFVTIRLSSLRRALINELEFWLRRNARGFCTKSGNGLLITTAGTWAIMFSCRITYISLRDLKSVRAVWPIGCRCGKALALDRSRRRFALIRQFGRRIISIDICDPAKAIPKNGITLSKTRFGRASSRPWKRGRTAERYTT